MTAFTELERYRDAILSLPPGPLGLEDVRSPVFRRFHDARLAVYYAPFDYINAGARIALVGVTPGPTQMVESFVTVREVLAGGGSAEEALRSVKDRASFKGMRRDLGRWLDELGVATRLGLPSAAAIFDDARGLLYTTSAIRYPAFVRKRDGQWSNYNGSSPDFFAHAELSRLSTDLLAPELQALTSALIVPLGKANRAVERLCDIGLLNQSRCLIGTPHPSPASPYRERYFQEAKESLLAQLRQHADDGEQPPVTAQSRRSARRRQPRRSPPPNGREQAPKRKEDAIVIELTQGNLNNNHAYLRHHLDFFPADSIGGPSREDGQGRLLTVHFAGRSRSRPTSRAETSCSSGHAARGASSSGYMDCGPGIA